jgi:hypothetical protein
MRIFNAWVATVGLALASAAVAAEAQQGREYAPPDPAQQRGQAGQQVSDQQLQQFAAAMENVRDVQQEYSQAIQEAGNMEEAQTLRADAQEEMRGAVEDAGLSVANYNMISQRLQSDPNLAQRLDDLR